MNRVDLLVAAAQSNPVKFMEATRAYSKSPSVIVCIFEGEDEKYFSCRLSMEFGDQGWKGINAGVGKLFWNSTVRFQRIELIRIIGFLVLLIMIMMSL